MTKQNLYHCWGKDKDQDQAIQEYINLYGEKPKEVFIHKLNLWLGPVPGHGDKIDDQVSPDCTQTLNEFTQLELPL